jgi:protein TonB
MNVRAIDERNRDRLKSMAAVAAFHALLGYALIKGLGFDSVGQVAEQLKMFNVVEKELPPPPPPTPAAPDKAEAKKIAKPKNAEGAASPANLRDTPTQIVAPEPIIVLPVPPPIPAAPVAGQGNAEAAGAADVPGPGTGSGGVGTGLGSGLNGDGTGGGGAGGGRAAKVRWISGRIGPDDYPQRAFEAGISGTVHLSFVVGPNGRVTSCAVTRSSGNAELDSTTCRLLKRRLRYRPATNAQGRPVPATIIGKHEWIAERRPDEVIEEVEEEEPSQ